MCQKLRCIQEVEPSDPLILEILEKSTQIIVILEERVLMQLVMLYV